MGNTIGGATPPNQLTGAEKFPISGGYRAATLNQIRAFVTEGINIPTPTTWTPVYQYIRYNDIIVKRLVNYIGGTGTPPTANLGNYLTSVGTFTSNINQAGDYSIEVGGTGLSLQYGDDFE